MPGYLQQINGSYWSDIEEVNGSRQSRIELVNLQDAELVRDLVETTIAPEQGCLYVFDFSETVYDANTGNVTYCPCLIPYDNNTDNPIQSGHLTMKEVLDNFTQIRPLFRSNLAVNYKYNTNLTNGLGNVERTVAQSPINGVTPTGLRNPTGSTLDNATVNGSRSTAYVAVPPQFVTAQGFSATNTTYSGPTVAGFSTTNTFVWSDGNTYQSNRFSGLRYTTNNQRLILGSIQVVSSYQNNYILEGGPQGTVDTSTNNRNVSGSEFHRLDHSQNLTNDSTLWGYKQNTTATVRVVFVDEYTGSTSLFRNFGSCGSNRGWRIRLSGSGSAPQLNLITHQQNTSGSARTTRTNTIGNLSTFSHYAGNGQWNLLHLTIDDSTPTTFRVYINGQLLGSVNALTGYTYQMYRATTNRTLNPYNASWGNFFSNEGWRGFLNEMSEYDHAFSTTEISNDFTAFKAKYWEQQ